MRIYLNLFGSEAVDDHMLALSVTRAELDRLRKVANDHGLAEAAIVPDYELIPYGALTALPTDGYIGGSVAERFEDFDPDDATPDAEPDMRLEGERLFVTPYGGAFFDAGNKYGDERHGSESLYLDDLDAWIAEHPEHADAAEEGGEAEPPARSAPLAVVLAEIVATEIGPDLVTFHRWRDRIRAALGEPEALRPGEFSRSIIEGYNVVRDELSAPFMALAPDGAEVGHYATERAAYEACDRHRMLGEEPPA